MFEKGSFVVKANNGICEISDVVTMNTTGVPKEYYVLVPISEKTAKVYVPVETAEQRIRSVMTKDESWKLIKGIKAVDEALVKNEKEREKIYQEAINSHDPQRVISIMKTLYIRRQKRMEEGKKNTAVDDRYFKMAENLLYGELAFSLGVSKEEVGPIIEANIE